MPPRIFSMAFGLEPKELVPGTAMPVQGELRLPSNGDRIIAQNGTIWQVQEDRAVLIGRHMPSEIYGHPPPKSIFS
jgi:hypothetical protein